MIDRAREAVSDIVGPLQGKLTINGTYAKLPEDEYYVTQAWSGDIVGAQFYLPKGTGTDVLGYWYPDDNKGLIGNDTMVIPTTAQNPAPRSRVPQLLPRQEVGLRELRELQRLSAAVHDDRARHADRGRCRAGNLNRAVVTEEMFTKAYVQGQLSADVDDLWLDAWDQIQAGS